MSDPVFKLGDFVQDSLTNYVGKICAMTTYLKGPTTYGLLSIKALSKAHGGCGFSTPQVFDWYPEDRIEPMSAENAFEAAERQRALQEERENRVYAAGQRGPRSLSDKNR